MPEISRPNRQFSDQANPRNGLRPDFHILWHHWKDSKKLVMAV